MAAGDTPITIVGNLVNDPELRFTASGQPVATFRVASTPRIRDNSTGEWKDGDSLFLTCNVWRQMAENCAESLQRGMRVVVNGRLRQRNYETQQGEKRTVYEIEVDDVGPSLLRASAKVTRATRASGDGGFGGGSSGGGNPGGGNAAGGSPAGASSGGAQRAGNGNTGGSWSGNSGNSGGNRNADSDPWASDNGAGYSDEPPF
jgi:single-strand DNA-binding protein